MKNKFNVGDKVRVVCDKIIQATKTKEFIGKEGVVVSYFSNSKYRYCYIISSISTNYNFVEDELELAYSKEVIESAKQIIKNKKQTEIPQPTKYIEQDSTTIVFFDDNTKVVVKQHADDEYDKEKVFAVALSKKMMGNYQKFIEFFKLNEYDDEYDDEYEEFEYIELKNPLFNIGDDVVLKYDLGVRGNKGEEGKIVSYQNQAEEIGRKFPYVITKENGSSCGVSVDEVCL